MEVKANIVCEDLVLEGLLCPGRSADGVVITHPHPLYGGDMHNPVVAAIQRAYGQAGWTTLRFNFRATGGSSGSHDQGIGEQEDVAAAARHLASKGIERIHLSGYSFGGWVSAMAMHNGLDAAGLTLVAPPVAFIPFDPKLRLPGLTTVVAGSRDEIAPVDQIRPLMQQWNPKAHLAVLEGSDHFFAGHLDEIGRILHPNHAVDN